MLYANATYSEENQDVTLRLCCVDLEDSGDCGMKVVSFWLGSVVDINRISTARN